MRDFWDALSGLERACVTVALLLLLWLLLMGAVATDDVARLACRPTGQDRVKEWVRVGDRMYPQYERAVRCADGRVTWR